MNMEQLKQKSIVARETAKELQQKLRTITNPEDRKQLLRQINDLFTQASTWRNEAKHRHYLEESIEREFNSIQADLEED